MDYSQIAAEFLRALRGKRSQTAFCRRLGYKSNVVYTWESKRGFPTAARALWAAQRVGVDLNQALARFYRAPPSWLGDVDVATPEGVAQLLSDLKGHTSIVDLARYSGKSRFAIARWLKAETEPKLPDFFEMVESSSLRLVDFLETLVDPRDMPSVRPKWEAMQVARNLAYEAPWTQAVLRALELHDYGTHPSPGAGWIADKIGISVEEVERSLKLLAETGQIREARGRWELANVLTLDTRKDPKQARLIKIWWGNVALDRFARGERGMIYNLFGVSAQDLERLRELQMAYFNEIRTIVAQSRPVERVALVTVQLLDLSASTKPAPEAGSVTPSEAPPQPNARV